MDQYSYCQYLGSSANTAKEKRPPLKRGQVKLRIVRSISSLVAAPGNEGDDASQKKAADRSSFRREASYN
uniref:Uncharacterized protein n=1 Tax=Oryza brachyantha TaxID=4533 RepID=J3M7Y9_ORYBR